MVAVARRMVDVFGRATLGGSLPAHNATLVEAPPGAPPRQFQQTGAADDGFYSWCSVKRAQATVPTGLCRRRRNWHASCYAPEA
jgi:hypothetical protein